MSALANMSEAERAIARLVVLTEKLYEISEQQLSWVEQHHEEEGFLEGFEQLSNRWLQLQTEAQEAIAHCQQMTAAEELKGVLSEAVTPMMLRAQDLMSQAIRLLEQKLRDTGTTLRTARGLRQAGKAYHSSGIDEHAAIFFDEKK